jgi:hypothetical protein
MFHRKKTMHLIVPILFLVLGLVWGCQKRGEEVPLEEPAAEEVQMPALPTKIMVSEDIAAAWTAVVLEVTDKDNMQRTEHALNIGETAPLGSTGLTINVQAFLPSFQMAGDVYTSSSPDLNNPAAKVQIKDANGVMIYDRWLFSKFPATHPFEHPRYTVVLKDYVASK